MIDGGTPFRNKAFTQNPEALVNDDANPIVLTIAARAIDTTTNAGASIGWQENK